MKELDISAANSTRRSPRPSLLAPVVIALGLLAAACGGGDGETSEDGQDAAESTESAASETDTSKAGIRLVSAAEGAEIQASPPEDLVILDVRTPDEFQEGHLEGAVMLDFYEADFAEQLAGLDPNVPYLLYCRSGNRSGQTAALMNELGFTDVADVDGGVVAWGDAGLDLVAG